MPRALLLIASCFAAFALSACDAAEPEPAEPPRALTAPEKALVEANHRFGLKLFRAVSAEEPQENVFLSPLSVSMALGMTLNGAEGATRAEMEAALELAGLSQKEINAAYQSLIGLLGGLDLSVQFSLANSIWYREGFAVEQAFIDTNKEFFDAEVAALDFSSAEAPARINAWVKEKTNGKIEKIVEPPIHPLTMMYLINAIYFKGDWQYQFDREKTEEAPFTLPDGSEKAVPMMTLEEPTLAYYRDERVTAVDLPYGDSLYTMTILLPEGEANSIEALAAGLDEARWSEITGGLHPQELAALEMPRFKLEYKKRLNDVLKAMGMNKAFDPDSSDFGGINPARKDLHISEVLHKTFVEVNEEGTEAAAVTSVSIGLTSVGPPVVRVDRPFVFAIRENHSGTILFIGQVADPAP